jgi:GNAT superfamily N-acetyltransferase
VIHTGDDREQKEDCKLSIEIRQKESLSDGEKQQLFGWGQDIFGVDALHLTWRPKDFHFLLYEEDKLVSHAGILKHFLRVDGRSLAVGGVSAVVTLVEARRQGYASLLLDHAARFLLTQWNVDVGLLFCLPRMVAYYQRLGWQLAVQDVIIDQPGGRIPSPLEVMILPFTEGTWPDGVVELGSLLW